MSGQEHKGYVLELKPCRRRRLTVPSKHRHFRCQISWKADNFGAMNFEHGTRLATHNGYARTRTDVTILMKISSRRRYGACESVSPSDACSCCRLGAFRAWWAFPTSIDTTTSRRTTNDEGVTSRVQDFLANVDATNRILYLAEETVVTAPRGYSHWGNGDSHA